LLQQSRQCQRLGETLLPLLLLLLLLLLLQTLLC
jgi:branched-subunit amino acid permease